jgi:hypothetical protein
VLISHSDSIRLRQNLKSSRLYLDEEFEEQKVKSKWNTLYQSCKTENRKLEKGGMVSQQTYQFLSAHGQQIYNEASNTNL